MEYYPIEYIEHNNPLLLLSGLGEVTEATQHRQLLQDGIKISSNMPPVDLPSALNLRDYFLSLSTTGIWPTRENKIGRVQNPIFRIRCIGRNFTIPARKSTFPPPGSSAVDPGVPAVLHSPLSPLTVSSQLYPDGVIDQAWLSKHQDIIPSVFISCYELYTASTDHNTQAYYDNELIKAVNNAKKIFAGNLSPMASAGDTSCRRTKLLCIITAEKSILESPDIDERILLIRRSTGLESNVTLFYLPAHSSLVEIHNLVDAILAKLFPGCLDYYRALSQRVRLRRKSKGTISPGWGCRYEFKLGVLAEFRQEFDAALKHYESAYKFLLPSLSDSSVIRPKRWSQARILFDSIALRWIRCLLWMESWTAAVRRWEEHVTETRAVLAKVGKGTNAYEFASWMSRWNFIFAEMIKAGDLPVSTSAALPGSLAPVNSSINSHIHIYALPEKARVLEKIPPQHHLHHAGFYYLAAANYVAERQSLISLDPSSSAYDRFMAEYESGVDSLALQIELFKLAKLEFANKYQKRMADMMSHNVARLKMEKGAREDLADAMKLLKEISADYRAEGWILLLEEALWRIIECAEKSGDRGQQIVAEFELLCSIFPPKAERKYDLNHCLHGKSSDTKPIMAIKAEDVIPFLSASYTFWSSETHVGEPVLSQLVLTSNAQEDSTPVTFSAIKITFEGSLKTILLTHNHKLSSAPNGSRKKSFTDLKGAFNENTNLPDELSSSTGFQNIGLRASADLSIFPGETKIFELSIIPREAGEGRAVCSTFEIVNEDFELEFILVLDNDDEGWSDELGVGQAGGFRRSIGSGSRRRGKGEITKSGGNAVWWLGDVSGRIKKIPIRSDEPTSLTILPKPPKMDIVFLNHSVPAYVGERITITMETFNAEDEEAEASLQIRILGYPDDDPMITWIYPKGAYDSAAVAPFQHLGRIEQGKKIPASFSFLAPSEPTHCVIEVTAHYCLLSNQEISISKTATTELPIVAPFSFSFDFSPRVHPDKWPSYFHMADTIFKEGNSIKATGIHQRWCLTASITNREAQGLILEGYELNFHSIQGAVALCHLVDSPAPASSEVDANESIHKEFLIDLQRFSLEDRRSSTIDASIVFKWRRKYEVRDEVNNLTLHVPRLLVPGMEPRVLAVASKTTTSPKHMVLDYYIENPTTYSLTFSITMETNEAFAFSGPKSAGIQLAPLTRHSLRYHIYPHVRNKWIKPHLRVEDRYFMKSLRCTAGGGSDIMGMDKQAMIVWVDDLNSE